MKNKNVNISVIIGNGFDIGLLSSIGKSYEELPTFSNFYNWLCERQFNPSNKIFKEINYRKVSNEKCWADIESIIGNKLSQCLKNNDVNIKEVINDVEIIRDQLSIFINECVTQKDLNKISKLSKENQLGSGTFSSFFADVSRLYWDNEYNFISFWKEHHINYRWRFLNLNYTTILENYFWIKNNPHPYETSNNNFHIFPNFTDNKDWTDLHVKLERSFYHPHGINTVADSIILGVSDGSLKNKIEDSWKYEKEYVGELSKYNEILENTNLFIIYGSSLGNPDVYWWKNILDVMKENVQTELLIYWYGEYDSLSENDIKNKFITNSGVISDNLNLRNRIKVIIFSERKTLKYGFRTQ